MLENLNMFEQVILYLFFSFILAAVLLITAQIRGYYKKLKTNFIISFSDYPFSSVSASNTN
jgi:uncharacterized membrane protein YhiD involved in acid resistance